MISSVLLNLIVSVVGAGLLAMVARTAYHVAGGRLEEAPATPTTELDTPYELERAASLRARRQRRSLVLRGAGE
jgi:hypothetical protein